MLVARAAGSVGGLVAAAYNLPLPTFIGSKPRVKTASDFFPGLRSRLNFLKFSGAFDSYVISTFFVVEFVDATVELPGRDISVCQLTAP